MTPLEIDTPADIIDPFAGVFRVMRRLQYLLALAVLAVLIESVMLWRSASGAHVFEVAPNGQASFIEDRQSRILPREYEATYVAKHFAELFYGWNSVSIAEDLAEATSMCSEALRQQLREEVAAADLVGKVRARPGGIRSEVDFTTVEVKRHSRRLSIVALQGQVHRYDLQDYGNTPFESRPFAIQVVMDVRRRSEIRPNGLEISRVTRDRPVAAGEES